jgi:hypothetical protein
MTKNEALIELKKWRDIHDRCEAVSNPIKELFGDQPETKINDAIWCGFEFATEQLNARLCADEVERFNDWMLYFAYDCDMGKKPKQVTKPNGESRKIATLDDVLWCMGYY